MAIFVYSLCAVTSLGCFLLLLRQYRRFPGPLLLHSAIAFLCLTVANLLLFVDRIMIPDVDMRLLRSFVTLVGVVSLLTGLIYHRNGREP